MYIRLANVYTKSQIYWIDIESHSSRPEMILMIAIALSVIVFEFRKWDLYIFPIDLCENQNLDRVIVVTWHQKCDLEYVYEIYMFGYVIN